MLEAIVRKDRHRKKPCTCSHRHVLVIRPLLKTTRVAAAESRFPVSICAQSIPIKLVKLLIQEFLCHREELVSLSSRLWVDSLREAVKNLVRNAVKLPELVDESRVDLQESSAGE